MTGGEIRERRAQMTHSRGANLRNLDSVDAQHQANLVHCHLLVVEESGHQPLSLGKLLDRFRHPMLDFSSHRTEERIILGRTWNVDQLFVAGAVFANPVERANLQAMQIGQ